MKLLLTFSQSFSVRAFTLESADEQTPVVVNVVEAESGFTTLKVSQTSGEAKVKVVTFRTNQPNILERLARVERGCEVRAEFGESATGAQAKFVLLD